MSAPERSDTERLDFWIRQNPWLSRKALDALIDVERLSVKHTWKDHDDLSVCTALRSLADSLRRKAQEEHNVTRARQLWDDRDLLEEAARRLVPTTPATLTELREDR